MNTKFSSLVTLFKFGWRTAASEKLTLLFGACVYCMYILIFSAIWKYTPFASKDGQDINFVSMVWYIAASELASFGGMQFREQVRADIYSQQLTGLMGRPLPYWFLKMLQLLGRGLLHLSILAASGFAVSWWLTGQLPYLASDGAVLVLPILMGFLLTLVSCFSIGMLDVWGQYARPVWWVWQKALFVLGGLMLPLTLYPEWLGKVALWTPFPAMVYMPAMLMLQHNAAGLGWILLRQIVWLVVFVALALWLHRAAKRHIGAVGD